MIEKDTIKLLRECDAGVKMGVSSIGDVLGAVKSPELKRMLEDCREGHLKLNEEVEAALDRFQDDGKKPNPIAKSMSSIKTGVKLALEESDHTVADLMTVSEPIQGRRRGCQGHLQAPDPGGGAAGRGHARIFVSLNL